MKTHQDIARALNEADDRMRAALIEVQDAHERTVRDLREQCHRIGHIWRWHDVTSYPRAQFCGVCGDGHPDN